jgi:hypothetical protein
MFWGVLNQRPFLEEERKTSAHAECFSVCRNETCALSLMRPFQVKSGTKVKRFPTKEPTGQMVAAGRTLALYFMTFSVASVA